MLSPAWIAVIVQLPAPVMVTVLPETVQLPPAVKLTGKFDVAVALTVKSASPYVAPVRAANVMVWSSLVTVNVFERAAAASVSSPAKEAHTPGIPAQSL